MTSAERMRRMRAAKVQAGLCVVCGQRKPRTGLTVCDECNELAKSRVYKSRGTVYAPTAKPKRSKTAKKTVAKRKAAKPASTAKGPARKKRR